MLDDTDRKIVSLIQADAKLSNAEIAESVGLTASSVHERVKKLEKRGVLRRYAAIVDAEMLGKPLLAFVRLTIGSTQNQTLSAAYSRINALCATEPDILECHAVAGEDCYVLKVRAANPHRLEKLLSAIKGSAENIRSVTNIVLSTRKETPYIEPMIDGGNSSSNGSGSEEGRQSS